MRIHAALIALVASISYVTPVTARDWAAYTSENFTIYSDRRERSVYRLLREFETFRQVSLSVLDLPTAPDHQRLLIVAYDRPADFRRVAGAGVGGFFRNSIHGPRMVVGPAQRVEAREILFHEYVHYLLSAGSNLSYPRWFNEGFAELLSSMRFEDSSAVIGMPPINVASVSLSIGTSVGEVIDTDLNDYQPSFYHTAWMLTHYLLLEQSDGGMRRNQVRDYLRRFDAGEDPTDAFVASFSMQTDEMQERLIQYTRDRQIAGLRLPAAQYAGEIARTVLDGKAAAYLLGDLAVEFEEYDAAHRYFDEFDRITGPSIYDLHALSRRAIALAHEQRFDEAESLMRVVIAAEPGDPDLMTDIAHFSHDFFTNDSGDAPGDPAILQRAIDYGERAIQAEPQSIEAHYFLALAHETNSSLQRAADVMMEAWRSNPTITRVNVNLARIFLKGGRPDYAELVLSRVYSSSHAEERRSEIEEILRAVRDGSEEALSMLPDVH